MKNENWYIRGCKELAEYFMEIGVNSLSKKPNKSLVCNSYLSGDNENGIYYLIDNKWNYEDRIDRSRKEITFKEFLDMQKLPIGYKLKNEKYISALKTLSTAWDPNCWKNSGYNVLHNSEAYDTFKKEGVLDLWFTPVYEKKEKFEIGDYITTFDKGVTPEGTTGSGSGGTGFVPNKTLKISSIDYHDGYFIIFCYSTYGIYSGNFRKATEEEILQSLKEQAVEKGYKEGVTIDKTNLNYAGQKIWKLGTFNGYSYDKQKDALLCGSDFIYKEGEWAEILPDSPQITVNDYKGVFYDNYVEFGCARISKYLFIDLFESPALKGLHTFGNKEIESITIGKGTFTKQQIKEIAEYYLTPKRAFRAQFEKTGY